MGNDITAFKQLKEKQVPQYSPIQVTQFMIALQKKIIDQVQCNFCKQILYMAQKCKTCEKLYCYPCLLKFQQANVENIQIKKMDSVQIRYCPQCSQRCKIEALPERFKESQKSIDQLLAGQLILCPKSQFGSCKQILNYEDYQEKLQEHYEKVHNKLIAAAEEEKQPRQSLTLAQKKKSNLFADNKAIAQSNFIIKKQMSDNAPDSKQKVAQSQMPCQTQQQQQTKQPVLQYPQLDQAANDLVVKNYALSNNPQQFKGLPDELLSIIQNLHNRCDKLEQENSALKNQLATQQSVVEIIQDELVKQFNLNNNKISFLDSQMNYLYSLTNQMQSQFPQQQQMFIQDPSSLMLNQPQQFAIQESEFPQLGDNPSKKEHYLYLINGIKQTLDYQNDTQQLKLYEYWEELLGFDDKSFWKVTYMNPDHIKDQEALIQKLTQMEEKVAFTNAYSLKVMFISRKGQDLVLEGIWLLQGQKLEQEILDTQVFSEFDIEILSEDVQESKQYIYQVWNCMSKEHQNGSQSNQPLFLKIIK